MFIRLQLVQQFLRCGLNLTRSECNWNLIVVFSTRGFRKRELSAAAQTVQTVRTQVLILFEWRQLCSIKRRRRCLRLMLQSSDCLNCLNCLMLQSSDCLNCLNCLNGSRRQKWENLHSLQFASWPKSGRISTACNLLHGPKVGGSPQPAIWFMAQNRIAVKTLSKAPRFVLDKFLVTGGLK